MERTDYDRVLDRLTAWAHDEPAVLGLVAVGSTAGVERSPDRWSDHDIAVVTRDGAARGLREDLCWLPDGDRVVLARRGTEHAWALVLDDGHLIELAVFEDAELGDIGINAFRVLLDRGGVRERFTELRERTTRRVAAADPDGTARFALLATELVIGLGRHGRGEFLSAHARVRAQALPCLLSLLADLVPAERTATLDGLDPHRRFELAHPERAERLRGALETPLLETVRVVLDVVERDLVGRLPAASTAVLPAIETLLARVEAQGAAVPQIST